MVMAHTLEEFITKIHVDNYQDTLSCYDNANLDELGEAGFTGLTPPFNTLEDAQAWWSNILGDVTVSSYWNTRLDPGQEQGTHLHVDPELGFDIDDSVDGQQTAVLYSKYNPSVHKPTYFSETNLRISEYKPAGIIEGDCLTFPSNIYHRAPKNTSAESRITSVCTFTYNV